MKSSSEAAVSVQNPAEFVSKQVELATAFGEKLRGRFQEFVTLSTEATTKVVEAAKVEVTKKAA